MDELTKSQFAQNLRTLMEKKKMKGSALATKAKLSKSAVSNYLLGKAVPNDESIEKLAKALGVSAAALAPPPASSTTHRLIYTMESDGGNAEVRLSGRIPVFAALEIYKIAEPYLEKKR